MFVKMIRNSLIKLNLIEKPFFSLQVVDKHPNFEDACDKNLFLIKNGKLKKMVCFLCPGRCRKKIVLPLSVSFKPNWQIHIDWLKRPSIEPSIRVSNSCRCHYWIKKGQVKWCTDNE